MDSNEKEIMIRDKMTKTCLCTGITRYVIKEVIKEGAKTIEEVRSKTGATTGSCKGRRCIPKINDIIKELS